MNNHSETGGGGILEARECAPTVRARKHSNGVQRSVGSLCLTVVTLSAPEGLCLKPPLVGRPRLASTGGAVATDVDVTTDLLTETYQRHYSSLLRLAALLLDDTASCEDVVQEAFIRVHAARNRVREPDKLLAYLRQTVVNLSRSTLRRRLLGLKLLPKPMPDMASAEEGAYAQLEKDALIQALRGLQRRQREVLVLRYFSDMTEAQVATALGLSIGSVKAYGSRGIDALRVRLEEQR